MMLPAEVQMHIFEFAYGDVPPHDLCDDFACWPARVPFYSASYPKGFPSYGWPGMCCKCNGDIWIQRFYIDDIVTQEKEDHTEHMFKVVADNSKIHLLQAGEDLTSFLQRHYKRIECAPWIDNSDYYPDYHPDDYRDDLEKEDHSFESEWDSSDDEY